jgi:K+/H+ antiporter YhaU regulatory subunit KhtT
VRRLSVRQRSLPGIGELLELDTRSGQTVTVVIHRSGRREIGLRQRGDETTEATAHLTAAEALALAGLLTGARVYLAPEGGP